MPRHRAVAIVVHEQGVLVMLRKNTRGEYYTFVGGGIEVGETPEQAAVRETFEESSLQVAVERPLYTITHSNGDIHYFFLCAYVSGAPHILEGTNEYEDIQAGIDYYEPQFVPAEQLGELTLYPIEIRDRLVSDLEHGFSDSVVEFSLPARK